MKKHPPGNPSRTHTPSAIVTSTTNEPHSVLFDGIDADLIQSTLLKTEGAAGPPDLDAAAWRRLRTSFKSRSTELCEALAAVGIRICTTYRSIKFNIIHCLSPDWPGQVSWSTSHRDQRSSHSYRWQSNSCNHQQWDPRSHWPPPDMWWTFVWLWGSSTWYAPGVWRSGVILVDATNAFNCLNISHLCPALLKVL